MVLPPETYDRSRKKALLHIQIELDPINQNTQEPNTCFPLSGK
jgi:hypothetical protein